MSKSTDSSPPTQDRRKPKKPYSDFPLFPHATKRWAKKIRGKLHYFGPWEDPQAALAKYLDQKDDLHAGRTPRVQGDGLTVRELLNTFLNSKQQLVNTRELSPLTFAAYHAICKKIAEAFGVSRLVSDLHPDDFEKLRARLATTWGPVRLGCEIQRIRTVFKYAFDAGLIAVPVRFGPGFRKPSKKTLRLHRATGGQCMFEAEEIRRMLDAAGPALKAMILLGINCGFGNNDVATLPLSALDLPGGWVNHGRPKTGIARRAPLWVETIEALKAWLAMRPDAKKEEDTDLVFVTRCGDQWMRVGDRPLSKETAKLLKKLGINGRRRLNYYALRHTHRTIADEAKDQAAAAHLMGHAPESSDMASVYVERIADSRLQAVAAHVRFWLFGK